MHVHPFDPVSFYRGGGDVLPNEIDCFVGESLNPLPASKCLCVLYLCVYA